MAAPSWAQGLISAHQVAQTNLSFNQVTLWFITDSSPLPLAPPPTRPSTGSLHTIDPLFFFVLLFVLLQVVRAPGLAVHGGAAREADGFLRESEADQQRAGPARTRERARSLIVFLFPPRCTLKRAHSRLCSNGVTCTFSITKLGLNTRRDVIITHPTRANCSWLNPPFTGGRARQAHNQNTQRVSHNYSCVGGCFFTSPSIPPYIYAKV